LEDILEELGETGELLASAPPEETTEPAPSVSSAVVSLDRDEQLVLGTLGSDPLTVETLCDLSSLPPARVAVALTGLQLKGMVRRAGSDLFESTGRA
jgi:predicted Rossmann fold nucleotide-binding protein DprA/Smf involved in DNA uptake